MPDIANSVLFDYFTIQDADNFTFFRIPKVLFKNEYFKTLHNDAKILYGLMLDRVSLSVKNKWVDNEGHVYIRYGRTDIQEELCIGHTKASKLLNELISIGLIECKRVGQGETNMYYVKNFASIANHIQNDIDDKTRISENANCGHQNDGKIEENPSQSLDFTEMSEKRTSENEFQMRTSENANYGHQDAILVQKSEKRTSGYPKNGQLDVQNPDTNNININNTNITIQTDNINNLNNIKAVVDECVTSLNEHANTCNDDTLSVRPCENIIVNTDTTISDIKEPVVSIAEIEDLSLVTSCDTTPSNGAGKISSVAAHIRQAVCYTDLLKEYPTHEEIIKYICNTVYKVITKQITNIKIKGSVIPQEIASSTFMKITKQHVIITMLSILNDTDIDISQNSPRKQKYIIATLYRIANNTDADNATRLKYLQQKDHKVESNEGLFTPNNDAISQAYINSMVTGEKVDMPANHSYGVIKKDGYNQRQYDYDAIEKKFIKKQMEAV